MNTLNKHTTLVAIRSEESTGAHSSNKIKNYHWKEQETLEHILVDKSKAKCSCVERRIIDTDTMLIILLSSTTNGKWFSLPRPQTSLLVLVLVDLHVATAAGRTHQEASQARAQQLSPDQVLVQLVLRGQRARLKRHALTRRT